MDLKPLLNIYNDWYGKLRSRERRLFFIFALVLAVSFYCAVFLKPALDDIKKLKNQLQGNKNQLAMLKTQLPSVAKAKQEIETKRQNLKDAKLKIADIESKLISSFQEQQLLNEVMKNAQKIGLDLESVKEDIKEEGGEFARVYIELKLASNYKKALTYIRSCESISPFIRIEEISVSPSKNEPVSTVEVALRLSALLSYASNNKGPLSSSVKDAGADIANLERSPFTPGVVTEKSKRKNLKVSGITYRNNAAGSTAIINGKIVRVGDSIEGVKIDSILSRSVVIDNGLEKETLEFERSGGTIEKNEQ